MLAVAPFTWDGSDVVAISLVVTAIMQAMTFVTMQAQWQRAKAHIPAPGDIVIFQSAALRKDAAL